MSSVLMISYLKVINNFFGLICTSKEATVAKMHTQDILTNLNTIEVSKQLRIMVYNNLSIMGESLNNALKLENLEFLNTSQVNISKNENIEEISRMLESQEENIFYEKLKSMKIVSPIKEVVKRHCKDDHKESAISFYK